MAAGAVVSPEILLEQKKAGLGGRFRPPRVVRVEDETIFKGDAVDSATLQAMFEAGLPAIYPDLPENDFIDTLFPGLRKEESLGIKLYSEAEFPAHTGLLIESLLQALEAKPRREDTAARESFIVWDGRGLTPESLGYESSSPPEFKIRNGVDDAVDPELDEPLEMEGFSLGPYPLINRLCGFQLGLVFSGGGSKNKTPCRNAFLSCFYSPDYPQWPRGAEETVILDAFGKVNYPLSMKFRCFIVDRLREEKALYLGSDGILVDKVVSRETQSDSPVKIDLITILNPSAPIIPEISVRRRGDDNDITWDDHNYEGGYQIYRGSEPDFRPVKRLLVGITKRRFYRDFGGAKIERGFYRVTRRWG